MRCYNERMRVKYLLLFIAVLLGFGFISIPFLPQVHADANSFTFQSFDADYYLSRDVNKRSVMDVRETLQAVFPDIDQNHGIERAIPNVYDEHPVTPKITGVTDEKGNALTYTTYESNNNTVVRIGEKGTFVHGVHTYVIQYTVTDVTHNGPNADELYWNTNGVLWSQPFEALTARFHIAKQIVPALDGRAICFSGAEGSTDKNCIVDTKELPDETVITTVSTQPLQPGQNVTTAIGFQKGTFAPYVEPPTPLWRTILSWVVILVIVPMFYVILPIVACVWAYRTWRAHGRDATKVATVIPEYVRPKGVSVLRASAVHSLGVQTNAVAATCIDLALRRYVTLYETDDKTYEFEKTAEPTDLSEEDRAVFDLLFTPEQPIGSRATISGLTTLYTVVTSIRTNAYAGAVRDGYLLDIKKEQQRMYAGGALALFLTFLFNPLMLVASIALFMAGYAMPARSEKGVQLNAYLDGMKLYMTVAETERIKLLQSPDTAEKIDVTDKGQLVKLYEKLLPFAMLFGIEKQWAQELAPLYEAAATPNWYVGNAAFNAVVFSNAISGFTAASTTAFAPPSSSGGSGFSGGSSGGGGGGGGGGGW